MDAPISAGAVQRPGALQIICEGIRRSDLAEGHRPQVAIAVRLPQNRQILDLYSPEFRKAVHKCQRVRNELFAIRGLLGNVGIHDLRA